MDVFEAGFKGLRLGERTWRMDALVRGALETAQISSLVIDLYEGVHPYLGNLLLVLSSGPRRARRRQLGPFYRRWNVRNCSVDGSFL